MPAKIPRYLQAGTSDMVIARNPTTSIVAETNQHIIAVVAPSPASQPATNREGSCRCVMSTNASRARVHRFWLDPDRSAPSRWSLVAMADCQAVAPRDASSDFRRPLGHPHAHSQRSTLGVFVPLWSPAPISERRAESFASVFLPKVSPYLRVPDCLSLYIEPSQR